MGTEVVTIEQATGRTLAGDIHSPIPHPSFDQTAVDGYAFRYDDYIKAIKDNNPLHVVGEIQAGGSHEVRLKEKEAVRIFTGAPMPPVADTVVMQEYVRQEDARIYIDDTKLKKGANIRLKGEQLNAGDLALRKGTTLTAAGIGFLSSLGIKTVEAVKLPKIGVVITGNEFVDAPEKLKPGKIFESNGRMLQAVMKAYKIDVHYLQAKDEPETLKIILQTEAEKNDITIVTGGVSVGKYDFTESALQKTGFNTIFHKVSQKPGKPVLFAVKENKAAFGLPGNPRAVLVCFYEYVLPYIKAIMGVEEPFLPVIKLPLSHDYEKKGERVFFLAGKFTESGVMIFEKQESHMLQTFSTADCLIALPGGNHSFRKGATVEVHLLPKI